MRIAICLILASLAGCTLCREHPVACSVGSSIVVSSVVTTIALHRAEKSMDAQMAAALGGQRP
jgi:hypothetical protein